MGTINTLPKAEMLAQLQNYRNSLQPRSPFPQVENIGVNLVERFTKQIDARPEADSAAMKQATKQAANVAQAAAKKQNNIGWGLRFGSLGVAGGTLAGTIQLTKHVTWALQHPAPLWTGLGVAMVSSLGLMIAAGTFNNKAREFAAEANGHRTFAASIENLEKYAQGMKAHQAQPAVAVAAAQQAPVS